MSVFIQVEKLTMEGCRDDVAVVAKIRSRAMIVMLCHRQGLMSVDM